MKWLQRRRAHRALQRLVATRQQFAHRVGRDGRGLDHVQRILVETLREERDASVALDRTRLVLSHLQQDRDLMAEALMVARAEVRRHHAIPFDEALIDWAP